MKQASGEVVVTLDGDGQNDPADIPKLLAELRDCDMVAGVRARRKDSWLRLAMSKFANSVRARLLGDGLRDTGCALKAFRREVVESFIPIRTLYSFMGAMAVAAGFRLRQVGRPPTKNQRRVEVRSFGVWWKPLVDMVGIFWFSRRRFPTRIELKTHTPINKSFAVNCPQKVSLFSLPQDQARWQRFSKEAGAIGTLNRNKTPDSLNL